MTGRAGGARRHTTPSRPDAVTHALGSAHRQAAALSTLMVLVLALVLLLLTVPARAFTVTDWILTDRPVGSDHALEGQGTTDDQSLAGRLIVCCGTMDDLQRIEVLANELGMVVKATLPQLKAALLSPTVPAQDHVGNVLPEHLTDALLAPAPVASKVAAQLRGVPGIVSAETEALRSTNRIPNDPDFPLQWWAHAVGLPTAWDISTGSASVTVAVLDTGLADLPDFTGRIVSPYSARYNSTQYWAWMDIVGHGSGTTGVAAATGNNRQSMAGTAWNVKIMPVHLGDSGGFSSWDTAVGMVWAVDHGANVINYSASGPSISSVEISACAYAYNHGVTVVAAAGNSGTGAGIQYPAALPTVIAVGATNSSNNRASFSSTGRELDLVAPGQNVLTFNLSKPYYWTEARSGTSFSAPIVTGVVALMLSRNRSLTPDQIRSILSLTADDLGQSGWDTSFGDGRVDAAEAVAAAGDRTAPTVSFLSPAPGATIAGDCKILLKAADNLSVKKLELLLDGVPQLTVMERSPRNWDSKTSGELTIASLTGTLAATYHSAGVTNGSTHIIEARAYDAAGNVGRQQLRLTVDNRPPTTTTTAPPATTAPPTTTPTTAAPPTTTRTLPPTTTTTLSSPTFVDVTSHHPYYEAIQHMWATGIIVGYEVGENLSEFRPSESVLRAQFAKMLAGAVDLRAEENMTSPFTDLGPDDPTSLYPHQYVAVAYANGIVAGLTPTTFGPWLNVARAQIISMMVRAASTLFPGALTEPPTVWSGSLGDFSPTHGANTRMAEYNGLLQGLTGFGPSWDPWSDASRGEVAQMLWNLMQRLQTK